MNDLQQLDRQLVWHPYTSFTDSPEPVFIESANGLYLHTADGKRIMDAVSSWWVNLHGHSHPDIASAIETQARKLEHVIFAGFTHEPAIRLAKNLLSILPSNQSRIFYSDNGSTAVEVAIKMAMQFWVNQGIERKKIIALKGAYHGDTFGAMSVGDRGLFTDPFSSYLFDVSFIDFPDDGHEQDALEQFDAHLKTNDVGVFIFEPLVQAAGGMRIYAPAILDKLLHLAREHGVICIADEVFTAFGRTGKIFASDYLAINPDIICLSKGITGGALPLGVTSCSQHIVAAFTSDDVKKTFFHGHSYTANPLACAAANASFSLLMDRECLQRIASISENHKKFKTRIQNHMNVKDSRCLGTILAIELKTAEGTYYSHDIRRKIYSFFMERNILLRPLGNIIYILPPYIITEDELNTIYSAIEDFLAVAK